MSLVPKYWLRQHRSFQHLYFEWVPGHMDIEGNEAADAKAKEAATGTTPVCERLPTLLSDTLTVSVAALKAERKKAIPARWLALWTSSPRFEKMSRIDKNHPSAQTAKILRRLPRRAASILASSAQEISDLTCSSRR